MEKVTIVISKEILQTLVDSEVITTNDFEVKISEIKDNLFEGDIKHQELKKASDKAFKILKNYEFKTRYKL